MTGRPKQEVSRNHRITIRLFKSELNRIKGLAALHTGGDLSELIRRRIFEGKLYGQKKK